MFLSICVRSLVMATSCFALLSNELSGAEALPTIQVSGASQVETQPKILRLEIQITSNGKGFKEALDKLMLQQESAKAEVLKLGAVESSVKLTPPNIGSGVTDEQRRMEMMVRHQMRQGGKPIKAEQKPETVTVNASLTADWNLSGDRPEQQLQFVHELKEKIKEADLSGLKKAAEAKSAEDEELAEEMEEQMGMTSYNSDGQPKPGEPVFIFVGQLADEARSKAMTEAIAKTKKSAESLAKAAGVNLGPIHYLTSQAMPHFGDDAYATQRFYRQYQIASLGQSVETEEVISSNLGPIKVNISVTISFQLK